MNATRTTLAERLLSRAIGDARVAEAIAGDLAEEHARFRTARLLVLTLRFAVRRRPHRVQPHARSKPMSTLLQDFRYGLRVLLRQPGFSAIVVLTLAVGLGANAAVFAMADGLLFRPLPVATLDGMVQVFETNVAQGDDRADVSPATFVDWRARSASFEALFATEWWDASLSDNRNDPERLIGRFTSVGLFEAMRVRPVIGRTFIAGEDTPGRNRVIIISHRLWQRRWAGAETIVGSTITIDRNSYTVIGVAPAGFDFPKATDLWAPLAFDEKALSDRSRRYLSVYGRLKPGVAIDAARGDMDSVSRRLADEYRATNAGFGAQVLPLSRAMLDIGLPPVMAVIQVTVLLVLLIAGANVANLLTVRGAARQRELALRLAVGASRWRVVRQLVVESVVLSIVGVALSIPFAAFGVRAIKAFMPPEIARWILGWNEIDVDGRLLGVTMIVGIVAGAVFGALPALRASRPDLVDSLKEGARGTSGGRRRVLQGFVVAQVALALALLVSAGLATRGTIRLLVQHDGYDPDGVMTFAMTLPQSVYGDDGARLRFFERLLERVQTLADVEHAAITSTVPFGDFSSSRPIEREGGPVLEASQRPVVDYCTMTSSFFQVLRLSLVRGRALSDADRAGTPLVAVIDQSMADRLWPGVDPVGKRFRPTHVADAPWVTVVGVVSNVKHGWFRGPQPTYYATYAQAPRDYGLLAVRVRGKEEAIVPAVRQVVRELDPNLPLSDVNSLRRWRSLQTTGLQFVAALVAAFAVIGLFLSAIGIYGVMAYAVAQRTREFGVRMALGATTGEVMRMTLFEAATLAAVGIAVGLVAAFGLGKLLVANLFGVVQLDVVSFVAFSAILAFVALVASSVPARRAMRVDPIDALRAD